MKWFKKDDILQYEFKPIVLENLHGYVLPHAGTAHTGHILAHTLRFRPKKEFNTILIIYLPAHKTPNVGKEYHEYHVPSSALKLYYPDKEYIGFNVLTDNRDMLNKIDLQNTLVVVSADFSHFLAAQLQQVTSVVEHLALDSCIGEGAEKTEHAQSGNAFPTP